MHSGGGAGGVRGGRKELSATAEAIKKGPWMAEEDAVLKDYVKKYGPRDWSSIRSKGLLPRTGKSCRLRWVNKLKPDLKTGCKFSAEEELVVIDLQAKFGNKWARIATHLPGRTDNDVKNFWSTRQKRLARLLQTPIPVRSHRNQGKVPMSVEVPNFEVATLPLLEQASTDREPCLPSISSPPQSPFEHSLLDLPLLSEGQDLVLEFSEMSFPGQFGCAESSRVMDLPLASNFFELEVFGSGIKVENPGTPESFFGDFPADMFECLDKPPVS